MRALGRMSLAALACLAPVVAPAAGELPEVQDLIADPWGPANQDPTEIYVLGDATFYAENPATVGADGQNDLQRREVGLFGMDLRNLAIWQPSLNEDVLWFGISVWDLQTPAPELGSWRWTFRLDGEAYQLEAARGGLTLGSTASGGLGTILTQPGIDAFRLLGPCDESGEDLSCPFSRHVGGLIDTNANLITWQVPIEGALAPGSIISPHPAGAESSFGALDVRWFDRATQNQSYTVIDRHVDVWIQKPDGTIVTDKYAAFMPSDHPFWANISVTHLDRGALGPTTAYDVVAQACTGTVCSTYECLPPNIGPGTACVRVML